MQSRPLDALRVFLHPPSTHTSLTITKNSKVFSLAFPTSGPFLSALSLPLPGPLPSCYISADWGYICPGFPKLFYSLIFLLTKHGCCYCFFILSSYKSGVRLEGKRCEWTQWNQFQSCFGSGREWETVFRWLEKTGASCFQAVPIAAPAFFLSFFFFLLLLWHNAAIPTVQEAILKLHHLCEAGDMLHTLARLAEQRDCHLVGGGPLQIATLQILARHSSVRANPRSRHTNNIQTFVLHS